MRILGIDPGLRITGYGVVDFKQRRCELVESEETAGAAGCGGCAGGGGMLRETALSPKCLNASPVLRPARACAPGGGCNSNSFKIVLGTGSAFRGWSSRSSSIETGSGS